MGGPQGVLARRHRLFWRTAGAILALLTLAVTLPAGVRIGSQARRARAELIDRDALIEALDSGRLAGFALDVGYQEPARADEPLLKYKNGNVILMPHTAVGARQNGLADLEEMCLKMWRAMTRGV